MSIAQGPILQFYRGDGFSRVFTLKVDGMAQDITGWTVYLTGKKDLADSDANALFQKKNTVHGPGTGQTTFALDKDDTDIEPEEGYWYDIQYLPPDGDPMTVRGKFNVYQDVTITTTP